MSVHQPDQNEAIHAAAIAGGLDARVDGKTVGELINDAVNTNYDIGLLNRLEKELLSLDLTGPATRSPDIPQILGIVEQITGGTSIDDINTYLEDTAGNSVESRSDLQRCGALLQKIAGIKDERVNWNLIFSRLLNKQEKAA